MDKAGSHNQASSSTSNLTWTPGNMQSRRESWESHTNYSWSEIRITYQFLLQVLIEFPCNQRPSYRHIRQISQKAEIAVFIETRDVDRLQRLYNEYNLWLQLGLGVLCRPSGALRSQGVTNEVTNYTPTKPYPQLQIRSMLGSMKRSNKK